MARRGSFRGRKRGNVSNMTALIASLLREQISFKQTPYDVKAR